MTKLLTALHCSILLLAIGGCMSTVADTNEPVAAVVASGDANKQALERAASELLFGRQIRFSATAFTDSSRVSIEKNQTRDGQGLPLNGRELQAEVIVFSLWKQAEQCWLKREDTEKQVLVEGVDCQSI
ncbi:hypothetical protein IC617_15875 [Neiella sp. HB171785]|uniref:Lipoprotein n=1 Tax=Neiella litorisoli TaxID=2771431 RepID=A0A8J6QKG8_9GAMM|nr:hypothetical protein [Neiella litorisoli]MBD1390909.1 hypothetical protein [Neiella litorisoli]